MKPKGKSVSTFNSALTLGYLIKFPENQYFERKGIRVDPVKPSKLADEIIGMLNADGGTIVLGIEDEGYISDLNTLPADRLNDYRTCHYTFIKPSPRVNLEEVTLDTGELIFIFHVNYDYERLFERADNGNVFRRVADRNIGPLSNDEIDNLRYDKSIRSYEEHPRKDFNTNDLDLSALEDYRKKIDFTGSYEELLVNRNLAIRESDESPVIYKNSAILLFAENPDKYIPSAYVRYIRYDGDEALSGSKYNVTKDERFDGNIQTLLSIVSKFIYASLDDYYYLDSSRGRFVMSPEYPEDAWLEGLVNALFHRSYNLHGNCIYIKHFNNRLEISNSGPLPAQVKVDNIRNQRFSRNPRIGRVLFELGIIRELNEGVKRIYDSMEESMLSTPTYTDNNDTVTLILENKLLKHDLSVSSSIFKLVENRWEDFNGTEKQLVTQLFVVGPSTVGSLAEAVDISPQAVRYYLKRLSTGSSAIIERQSDKLRDINALYAFKKESGDNKESSK